MSARPNAKGRVIVAVEPSRDRANDTMSFYAQQGRKPRCHKRMARAEGMTVVVHVITATAVAS